eukprot:GEMP01035223.1.p2 GENE.GEMP01035223.1~~GEMP01035223.1.p2  ORF type:complete len:187 (+),score=36.44 GEMP01035223.1:46-561(+)
MSASGNVVKSLLSAATALDSESRGKPQGKHHSSKYTHWQKRNTKTTKSVFGKKDASSSGWWSGNASSSGWRSGNWATWETTSPSAPQWKKIGDQWFSVCPTTGWHEPWRAEKVDKLETFAEPSAPRRLPPNDDEMEDIVVQSEVMVAATEGSYASTGPSVPAADAPEVIYA